MKVKQLKNNPENPRSITTRQRSKLEKSMEEYGDLGAIIFNIRTGFLAGGHQRSSVIDKDTTVVVEKRYDVPTRAGTVAEGHISIKGERFKYREVDWDSVKESAAMIAANKHGGQWDQEKLNKQASKLHHLGYDLDLTGLEIGEIKIEEIKIEPILPLKEEREETDEQYVARTKTDEVQEIETTNRNANQVKSVGFDEMKEEPTKSILTKHLVILEFQTAEEKDEAKKKLRAEYSELGVKIL